MSIEPKLIYFQKHGSVKEGYLDVASFHDNLPFEIKRTFWVYDTPSNIIRGRHAHFQTQMVLIALSGSIEVKTETSEGIERFILEKSDQGLLIPRLCWHEMKYTQNTIQLVLASSYYDPQDYIRDYSRFKSIIKGNVKD